MRPVGAVNLSNWIGGLAVIGGAWAGIIFVPVYLDNMGVGEAVDAALTLGYRSPPDQIATKVLFKVAEAHLGTHWAQDEDTKEWTELPGLNLDEDNIRSEANEVTRTLRITVDYVRTVRLTPSWKFRELHFHIEKARTE